MAKPNILFVGQFAPPVHGVSVMNDFVANSELIKKNYDYSIVNLTTATAIEDIGKPAVGKYLKFLGILINTLLKLLTRKYCCAYLTLSPVGFAFTKDAIVVQLIKLFKVPVVLHLHGKGIHKAIAVGGDKSLQRYNKVFKDTFVITLSEGLKQDIGAISSFKKCFVVNNGIPQPVKLNSPSKTDRVHILMLSNLIRSKGAMDLLKAVKILVDDHVDGFNVTFAGAWSELDFMYEFRAFINDNNLAKYVSLPGPVYGDEKREAFTTSDIFVLPTYYANECFPLTILEAMSYGLPVVTTSEGAIAEIIDHKKTGFLVPAQNPAGIAQVLKLLIRDKELRSMIGINALDKFNRHYRLDIFEKNLLHVFNQINS